MYSQEGARWGTQEYWKSCSHDKALVRQLQAVGVGAAFLGRNMMELGWFKRWCKVLSVSQMLQKSRCHRGRTATCWEGVFLDRYGWTGRAWHPGGWATWNKGMWIRYRTVNWELRTQILGKAHPEGGGNSDLNPQLEFHMFPGSFESFRILNLKRTLRVLFLIFWETPILFSIVAAPIYNPTNSASG